MSKKETQKGKAIVVKANETRVVETENRPYQMNPETLIANAIEKGLPVETMERLLAMRKELKAEWAKEQYDLAMANLQAELPIVKKSTNVKDKQGKDRYSYAKIEHIVDQTKDTIARNGFSYKIEIENDDKFLTAKCIVTHKDGHVEVSPFKVPISTEEYMTEVQKYGARASFAKRYAFCNAFGITTAGEDVDGEVKGKAKAVASTTDDKKALILKAIKTQKNTDAIIQIAEKTSQSDEFDEEFKAEVHRLANSRVDELSGGQ